MQEGRTSRRATLRLRLAAVLLAGVAGVVASVPCPPTGGDTDATVAHAGLAATLQTAAPSTRPPPMFLPFCPCDCDTGNAARRGLGPVLQVGDATELEVRPQGFALAPHPEVRLRTRSPSPLEPVPIANPLG